MLRAALLLPGLLLLLAAWLGAVRVLLVRKLVLNHAQVVVKRLHIWVDLGVHIARQIPYVTIAQRDDGAGQIDLLVAMLLLQGSGEGKQGLASAGAARNRNQRNLRVQQSRQGKRLLRVFRRYSRGGLLRHADVALLLGAVRREDGFGTAALDDEVLVGGGVSKEVGKLRLGYDTSPVQRIDDRDGSVLDDALAGIHGRLGLDVRVVYVVLRGQAQRPRFHAQVHVLRHQNYRRKCLLIIIDGNPLALSSLGPVDSERMDHLQNAMIRAVAVENLMEQVVRAGIRYTALDDDLDLSETLPEWDAGIPKQKFPAGKLINSTKKLSRVEVDYFVALLELVQLLEDCDGEDHIMLAEVEQAVRIVKNHVRVQHIYASHLFGVPRLSTCLYRCFSKSLRLLRPRFRFLGSCGL
mmetsp:Transcript_24560/g.42250  ORF Transcript_24560/g.42250 Transcript_24560/m.42250 type:complete len:409 (+) Transcript_24560:1128-2354(+)